jgi:ABC-type nitrate/sulfonate/bicarbonate transport system permease component
MSTVAPISRAGSTPFFFGALERAVGPTLARRFSRPGFVRLILVILLFMGWEVGVRLFGDPLFLSPPTEVVGGLVELVHDAAVVNAVLTTLWEIFVAFGLAVIVGIILGLAVGLQGFTRRSIFPIVLLLYATPQVVFLPLVILYFGIGAASKVAFGFSHGVFPIIVTVVAGVQNINPVLLTAARSMGASRRQVLRWVVFPHMVPSLFTGMRLGMTGVLLGVLLAELYVSAGGIGYYTRLFTDTFVPSKVFALIGVLSLFAVCLNEAARKAEQYFQKWRG